MGGVNLCRASWPTLHAKFGEKEATQPDIAIPHTHTNKHPVYIQTQTQYAQSCVATKTCKWMCVGVCLGWMAGFDEGSFLSLVTEGIYVQSMCWYSVKMEDTHTSHAGRGQQVKRMELIVHLLWRHWAWWHSAGGGGRRCLKSNKKTESAYKHWAAHRQNHQ